MRAARAREPAAQDRIVGAQDPARAREQLRAPRRRERDPRQPVVDRARRDRRVVVDAPERVDDGRRPGDPPMRRPGSPVRLREAARHDRALRAAPDGRRFDAIELGASIDLVGHHPCADAVSDTADPIELGGASAALRSGCSGCRSRIELVRSPTSAESESRSVVHRDAAHERPALTVAPRPRARPRTCM